MKQLVTLLTVLAFSSPAWASSTAYKGGSGGGGTFEGTITDDGENSIGLYWTTLSIDDCALNGQTDGAGCDANPFPAADGRDSFIMSAARIISGTYTVDNIHMITGFNTEGGGAAIKTDLLAGNINVEYSYGGGKRAGAEAMEWYFEAISPTYVITFDSVVEQLLIGDDITFTGGEICRATISNTNLSSVQTVRMLCVNDDAPENNDVVTACDGTCTGDPTAPAAVSVNGAPTADTSYRPFFMDWDTDNNASSFEFTIDGQYRADGNPNNAGVTSHGLSMSGSNRTVHLGWNGVFNTTEPTAANAVTIPAFTDHSFSNPSVGGEIAVDISNNTTFGGQFVYHDGDSSSNGTSRVLSSIQTDCSRDLAFDGNDNLVPFASWPGATVVALGCMNLTAAPATNAVITLEDQAGNAITLSGTMTCSDNNVAMAWTTTTDADAILTSGEGLRYDVGTDSTTTTDDHVVCIAYRETRR